MDVVILSGSALTQLQSQMSEYVGCGILFPPSTVWKNLAFYETLYVVISLDWFGEQHNTKDFTRYDIVTV